MRSFVALLLVVTAVSAAAGSAGCASSPAGVAVVPPVTPAPPVDTRVGWILRLEDQRLLRDPSAGSTAIPVQTAGGALTAARTPDLAALLKDEDAAVRARAALAVGRVQIDEGWPLLVEALRDPSPQVRANAAFGLGISTARPAVTALQGVLADPDLTVRARGVEALGLIGDAAAVPAIVQAAGACAPALAPMEPDAEPAAVADPANICRLALFALVRLQSYDGIAALALDPQGQPVSRWWPVAYALQRINDPRAAPALRSLAAVPGVYTPGFAFRGLAAQKDTAALPAARAAATRREVDVKVRIAAVRLLAQAGGDEDARLLSSLFGETEPASPLAIEIITALGTLGRPVAFELLIDSLGDRSPAVRAAALTAAAKVDPEGFLLILAGLGRDRDWTVRAALAPALSGFTAERVSPALEDLAADEDPRVHGPALEALAAVKSPALPARLQASLAAEDFAERATAARLVGQAKLPNGVPLLAAAYKRGQSDTAYAARAAALEALAAYGGAEATATIEQALNDREWPVRVRAASLLRGLGRPDAVPARPAPPARADRDYQATSLLRPRYSPHALIDTRHGTIEVQLDVVGATLTTATFIDLARQGFFNGIRVHRLVPTFVIQTGDPRGDGEGGPGFTLRDELNPTPYVRGTLGMALDWADTGGSQWFITLSPQPHLDGRYTAFGRVVNGWDVLDRVSPWDVVERVRIWDGIELR